jgi:hypothetical protein
MLLQVRYDGKRVELESGLHIAEYDPQMGGYLQWEILTDSK